MAYILNDEQNDLIRSIGSFMEKEIGPYVSEAEKSGELPLRLYEKAFRMGLHCMNAPEEYGGGGIDLLTSLAIAEEMSKTDAGVTDAILGTGLTLGLVLTFGNEAQKRMVADRIIPGRFAAFALTEPNAGSDAAALETTAIKDGDEYVLNGRKCFITNGGVSDIYIIFAYTDKSKGTRGISAFIVEKDRPGLSSGKEEDKMGIRNANTCDVLLEDVRIPADHLIGVEGKGFKYAMQSLDQGRLVIAAMAVGIAQRALNEAIAYSRVRKTFGKPICELQAIRFMIADMDIQIETARQMVVHAARLAMNDITYSKEAAIAKCYAGDICMKVTTDAVQILGGYGYSREYPVEKLMRDAKIFQIFEGTNQIQRIVIAGHLLK